MEDMPRKQFLSHEKTRHGKMVWYFKRNGRRVRLPATYGTDEFNAAYEKALTGSTTIVEAPKLKSGSIKWLIDQYKRSSDFSNLAASTRRQRDNILLQVLKDEKTAGMPFVLLSKQHIKKAIDKRATTPEAANNFLKTMKHLCSWALSAEHIDIDPTASFSKINVKTDGFHTWSVEEVEKYRAFHKVGTRARLAIDLLLFLGLRRSDVVVVGRQHLKEGVISLKTTKTGVWVYLPVFKQLQESIDATKTADLAFLATAAGKPFSSAASFGNWFRDQCVAAKMPDDCRAHGLRKAGATIAANEGATAHELMAMFGWSRLAMAEVYTREADKRKLARAASERLSNKM
jgi:integrase